VGTWAIDLGTSNTAVAGWRPAQNAARRAELRPVARSADPDRPLDTPGQVPTVLELLEPDLATRASLIWPLRGRVDWGRLAVIGEPARQAHHALPRPSFCNGFKSALSRDPQQVVARLPDRTVSAREAMRAFLRELLSEIAEEAGERPSALVFTTPIEAFEAYRGELRSAAAWLGVRDVRFVDEPVAAALGYGLGLGAPRRVLVFDMGGGTLHAAMIELRPRGVERGEAQVLAKHGRAVGGNLVDRWILEDVCARVGIRLDAAPQEVDALWQRVILGEARRVKERAHFVEAETFVFTAPEELRGAQARLAGRDAVVPFGRSDLRALLEKRGLYALLDEVIGDVVGRAGAPDEVLMVGGSTLLPGVFPWFEHRFGRDRVRAWQPFEAVSLGAAVFAGGGFAATDHIVHDYAIRTTDARTGDPVYTTIVPAGTPFPSNGPIWRRQLVPTCALGTPETLFKLVIAEVGQARGDGARFGWDASGNLQPLGRPGEAPNIVPLNEANPTLGTLDPPHPPGDRTPRLDVAFSVNADRWLCATVADLRTQKTLLEAEPVARLL
jgi:molecular chaperone DnaK (HSP70)